MIKYYGKVDNYNKIERILFYQIIVTKKGSINSRGAYQYRYFKYDGKIWHLSGTVEEHITKIIKNRYETEVELDKTVYISYNFNIDKIQYAFFQSDGSQKYIFFVNNALDVNLVKVRV